MTVLNPRDFALEVPIGTIPGVSAVHKFGETTNADNGVKTDVWDGANSSDDIAIWVAPTAARVHALVSTSASDTGNITIWGLKTWSTAESTEVVDLDGTTPVNTANSYVIIHRMEMAKGTTNVGVITATAATDSTLTAQILVADGRTQMAIYGVPSTQNLYITHYYASAILSAAALTMQHMLMVNEGPEIDPTKFIVEHIGGVNTTGTSQFEHEYNPYFKVTGPAIVKMQVIASRNDTIAAAGFDAYLETI